MTDSLTHWSHEKSPEGREHKLILEDPADLIEHEAFDLANVLQHLSAIVLISDLGLDSDLLEQLAISESALVLLSLLSSLML